MIKNIDGTCYAEIIFSGIKNLERYKSLINDLNVFPVPDGDTGTNMLMTLRYGYEAIKSDNGTLSDVSQKFSSAAVFGARGNSGVIISQFFKGISDVFKDVEEADCEVFAKALRRGCDFAYASVVKPVEGTMLTVLKDASNAVSNAMPIETVNEAIGIFLNEAKISLTNTPELLPILKKAGVVDSGGSGVVCFFEGIQKYLKGEDIDLTEESEAEEYIDLSLFDKNTVFEYGYCVEGLIQLRIDTIGFNNDRFKRELARRGSSVVSSLEGDKVKIHIHTKKPGQLISYCQNFGEFLTIKIENMTVQHIQRKAAEKDTVEEIAVEVVEKPENVPQKFLYDPEAEVTNYSVIAVATNSEMQERLFEMGADVVILSDIAPSSQDFLDAFALVKSEKILVFPNSANTVLASRQAGDMYEKAEITVLNTRTLAECFAILAVMDFDGTPESAVAAADDTLSSIYQYSIYHAVRDVEFGEQKIDKNDYFALEKNKILNVGETLDDVILNTVEATAKDNEYEVITLYYGKNITDDDIKNLSDRIDELNLDIEVAAVPTYETVCEVTVTFE